MIVPIYSLKELEDEMRNNTKSENARRQSSKPQVLASVIQEGDSEKLPQNSKMIPKVTDSSRKIKRVAGPPSLLAEVILQAERDCFGAKCRSKT